MAKTASIRPGRFGPGELGWGRDADQRGREASIRPGRFGPGEDQEQAARIAGQWASIRPGRFGPGERRVRARRALLGMSQLQLGPGALARESRSLPASLAAPGNAASIRPGRFGPGEGKPGLGFRRRRQAVASIRPGRFGPGEDRHGQGVGDRASRRFN